jgi:hypothetical protein
MLCKGAMKKALVLLIVMLAARWVPAQGTIGVAWAPLLLYTNGTGSISNLCCGQMLQVGQRYIMTAVPDRSSQFNMWRRVKKSVEVKTIIYPSSVIIITTNTVVLPASMPLKTARMSFVMEPVTVQVRNDNPGTSVITTCYGWRAEFVPNKRQW